MHSRIIQVDLEPIEYEDYITPELVDDEGFIDNIADYVVPTIDRNEDIVLLSDILQFNCSSFFEYDSSTETMTFREGIKEAYFEQNLKRLKKAVSEMSLSEFMDPIRVCYFKSLFQDDTGLYIYDTSDGAIQLLSLDRFMRMTPDVTTKYYIGNTLDYHF